MMSERLKRLTDIHSITTLNISVDIVDILGTYILYFHILFIILKSIDRINVCSIIFIFLTGIFGTLMYI